MGAILVSVFAARLGALWLRNRQPMVKTGLSPSQNSYDFRTISLTGILLGAFNHSA
jgi:hypothetical protein